MGMARYLFGSTVNPVHCADLSVDRL